VGFRKLSEVLQTDSPSHERILFLEGYEGSSNSYAITGDDVILIDAANDYTVFVDLAESGFPPERIAKVVLTHGHPDHSLGVLELLRQYRRAAGSLEVWVHKDGPRTLKKMVEELGGSVKEIEDGQQLDLNDVRLEVVHTPGHTIDSVCLYERGSKTLFTGDTVTTDPGTRPAPDPAAGGSAKEFLSSLRRLSRMEILAVCPGHGAPLSSSGGDLLSGIHEQVLRTLIGENESWSDAATKLLGQGLLEEAVFCADKGLEQNPGDPSCLEIKASCLSDLGELEQGLAIYDALLASGRSGASVWVGKGFTLLRQERFMESLECFEQVLRDPSAPPEARIGKGLALIGAGRHDEAFDIPEFERYFSRQLSEEAKKIMEDRTAGRSS
jgi:glyoxylase-like metal-dependent hydrolase (beta-lactamase superfamily II)